MKRLPKANAELRDYSERSKKILMELYGVATGGRQTNPMEEETERKKSAEKGIKYCIYDKTRWRSMGIAEHWSVRTPNHFKGLERITS